MQTRAPAAACATRGEGSPWVWTADPFGAGVVFFGLPGAAGSLGMDRRPGRGRFFSIAREQASPGVGRRSRSYKSWGSRPGRRRCSLLAGHWFFSLDQGPGAPGCGPPTCSGRFRNRMRASLIHFLRGMQLSAKRLKMVGCTHPTWTESGV